ncbi:MAG: hypothetical protein H0V56_00185 [Chthoniobacterales bacterium]|nr:hypothetical protein [Chthoniobacterales bacterium]
MYNFALDAEARHVLLRCKTSDRQQLVKFFQALADDPYRRGDFNGTNADDRAVEVALCGRFLVTYWSDHAVKQVRVVLR